MMSIIYPSMHMCKVKYIGNVITTLFIFPMKDIILELKNKSWKPECVLSFNMLKLKTHSGFHELF